MIAVIDYDMGNVGSILNMLRKLGVPAKLTHDRSDLFAASGLILPGVGAFGQGMRNLRDRGLIEPLHECVTTRNIPLLGICLGMQLLTQSSEEGDVPGLGWISGHTIRFRPEDCPKLRIPHMGWNEIRRISAAPGAPSLYTGLELDARFYFVHSFHVECDCPEDVQATSSYGRDFTASIRRGHVMGTQFHPEKSHRYGLQLMRNFAAMTSCPALY